MRNTPANIAADEVKDPLPSVVDGDMGKRVCNDEPNKDTNTTTSANINYDEMMHHTRQTAETLANMMQMMKSMQGEISRLTKKCDGMEKSLQKTHNATQIETVPKKQNTNIKSRLDSMEKSMQKTQNICTKMDKSINTIQKKQNSMHSYIRTRFYDMDDAFESVEERIEESCDSVHKKLKYHEILLKNQKWKYSAQRPSWEYWENDVWDEEEAEAFLRQIEDVTNKMRNGTSSDGFIDIGAQLPYNDVFLPHWKEFADAIEQFRYHPLPEGDNESHLRLCNMELPETVIDLLSKALESTLFHKFTLVGNTFGQNGIDLALNYFENNDIMVQFHLSNNLIAIRDIKRLSKIIRKHRSIKHVALTSHWYEGFNTYQMLKSIMSAGKTKLTSIDVAYNRIRTGGGTFISNFIVKNPILANLHINNNLLEDDDAVAIARALENNTTLCTLDIRGNNLTSKGWRALQKAVFNKTSLNSAADSNHTCTIDFPTVLDDNTYQEVISMNGSHPGAYFIFDEDCVRQKKIYNILSTRNRSCSNVEHFKDVPFELFPDMVVSIKGCSNYHIPENTPTQDTRDVKPLSIIYEICRHWDEALAVFESLSSEICVG